MTLTLITPLGDGMGDGMKNSPHNGPGTPREDLPPVSGASADIGGYPNMPFSDNVVANVSMENWKYSLCFETSSDQDLMG